MTETSFHKRLRAAAILAAMLIAAFPLAHARVNDPPAWLPVSQAELDMKTPKVEPDADAEAIFWDVRVDDKKLGKLTYKHYVRVKIFTERGRERFAKMDIPFMKGKKVEDVAARVIRPDGSIVDLKPTDIFDREIARAGKFRMQAKSFAVPGIEPGVIVEYQYSESIKGDSAGGERLVFQRDIPMQRVSYAGVRPYGGSTLAFNPYNMPDTKFVKGADGFFSATLTNVPAYKEEPYMPPDDEVRKWVYVSYRNLGSLLQWGVLRMRWGNILKSMSKPKKELRLKAEQLTAGAANDEEKIRRIYDFVQKGVKNVSLDPSFTEDEVEDLDIDSGNDILKRGMGTSTHIDLLFAALAKAAGVDVAVVLSGDRSDNFFNPDKYPFANFVQWSGFAVKIGTQWKFFDPCGPYMPFAAVPWHREDTRALIITEDNYVWYTVPASDPSVSPARRSADLKLLPDGTLEGKVKIEYEGHQALSRRRDQFKDSPVRREEILRDEVKANLSSAEVTGLSVLNFDDSAKPLTYVFDVKVPNYAQKVGKRMLMQPGFFENGSKPVFSSATRTYNITFPYAWSESDDVKIRLPEGYELDGADSPGEIADNSKIGSSKVSMSIDRANTLLYSRKFHFGGGGKLLFPATSYQPLKALFDAIHKADTHAISIRQKQ